MALLFTHIVIALSSIVYSTYNLVSPSRGKLYASYGLVGATIATGTALVITTHSRLLASCMAGLIYLGVVTALLLVARFRMQAVPVRIRSNRR